METKDLEELVQEYKVYENIKDKEHIREYILENYYIKELELNQVVEYIFSNI